MPFCAIYGCSNSHRNSKGVVKFFRFPKDSSLRTKWIHLCKRRDNFNVETARICSTHFEGKCYAKSLQQQLLGYSPKNCRKLSDDAVPTLHLPLMSEEKDSSNLRMERQDRRVKRKLVESILEDISLVSTETCQDLALPLGQQSADECNEIDMMERRSHDVAVQATENVRLQPSSSMTWYEEASKLEEENRKLKMLVQDLKRQNEELLQNTEVKEKEWEVKLSSKIQEILSKYFTPGQIKCILNPGKRIIWSKVDVSSAISLRYVSAKAYRYLRNKLKYPLPGLTTLKSWVAKYGIDAGLQTNVLSIMGAKSCLLTPTERLTVISFDEMKVKSEICIERKSQEVLGPVDHVQVVMARSLMGKWKQPVFYDFDQHMNKKILFSIIVSLEKKGYHVVAQVSDLGPTNRRLWKELKIDTQVTSFANPYDHDRQIFVFADVPHLMKLFRNHLVDQGFVLHDGTLISVSILEKLYSLQKELNVIPKITLEHIHPTTFRRQKVKLATQLLSNTVATALRHHEQNNQLANTSGMATVIKLMNDFFDVFNSYAIFDKYGPRHAYGTNLQDQEIVLDNVCNLINSMRVVGSKSLQPFQRGILVSVHSLKELFSFLQKCYGTKYVMTGKLNQDVLESFFSYIRGLGKGHDHPNAVEFKQRFRAYVMGKHSEAVFTVNQNTESNVNENCLIDFGHDEMSLPEEVCITEEMSRGLISNGTDGNEDISHLLDDNLIDSDLERDGLVYLAGYVAARYKLKYPWLVGDSSEVTNAGNDWIQRISRGSLTHPSDEFVSLLSDVETEFKTFHGQWIYRGKNAFSKLIEKVLIFIDPKWPKEVLECFIRTRTYIRVKTVNQELKEKGLQFKKKLKKLK